MIFGRRAPEMIEADIVERGGRLEGRDMTAQFRGFLVGANYHRDRVPSHDRADTALDLAIAGIARLLIGRNRVYVRSIGVVRQEGAALTRLVDQILEQEMRAIDAFGVDQRVE
jgi:hypothetical protein